MKKIVNGKVVDIENLELFVLAAEGLALRSTAVSVTDEGLKKNIDYSKIKQYIDRYNIIYKALPYPLYAIERKIKYATIANFIKELYRDHIDMWVDDGVYILIDKESGMTLHLVSDTWSIEYIDNIPKDNISMELYSDSIGYLEYKWVLKTLLSNSGKQASFYSVFMPDFLEACNNQPMIIKWELENMLTFSKVPNKTELVANKIIDIQGNYEYSLDIYYDGSLEVDEEVATWNIASKLSASTKKKTINSYKFDVYEKKTNAEDASGSTKVKNNKLIGLHSLFFKLCSIKNVNNTYRFPEFKGVKYNNNIVFEINNRLYIAKASNLSEAKDIAHGINIYAIENNKVFFTKDTAVNDEIKKEVLYSYNLKTEEIRICKIIFIY